MRGLATRVVVTSVGIALAGVAALSACEAGSTAPPADQTANVTSTAAEPGTPGTPTPTTDTSLTIPAKKKGELCRATLAKGRWTTTCPGKPTINTDYVIQIGCLGTGQVSYKVSVDGSWITSGEGRCGQNVLNSAFHLTSGKHHTVHLEPTTSGKVTSAYAILGPMNS